MEFYKDYPKLLNPLGFSRLNGSTAFHISQDNIIATLFDGDLEIPPEMIYDILAIRLEGRTSFHSIRECLSF